MIGYILGFICGFVAHALVHACAPAPVHACAPAPTPEPCVDCAGTDGYHEETCPQSEGFL